MIKKIIIATVLVVVSFVGGFLSTKKVSDFKPGAVTTAIPMFNPTVASSTIAANTSTVVLATSTGRQYAIITNDSANVVYLSIGRPALTGKGIRLSASGGQYVIDGNNLFQGPVYGISSAISNITTLEE